MIGQKNRYKSGFTRRRKNQSLTCVSRHFSFTAHISRDTQERKERGLDCNACFRSFDIHAYAARFLPATPVLRRRVRGNLRIDFVNRRAAFHSAPSRNRLCRLLRSAFRHIVHSTILSLFLSLLEEFSNIRASLIRKIVWNNIKKELESNFCNWWKHEALVNLPDNDSTFILPTNWIKNKRTKRLEGKKKKKFCEKRKSKRKCRNDKENIYIYI